MTDLVPVLTVFLLTACLVLLIVLLVRVSASARRTEEIREDQRQDLNILGNQLLDELIDQSVELVGVPVAFMTKEDKIKAIQYLNDSGAFLITKSGDKVSKFFGISKYTLYSYVNINK